MRCSGKRRLRVPISASFDDGILDHVCVTRTKKLNNRTMRAKTMDQLDRWDILLLLGASYVAVMSLVRLMTARRDRLVAEVQQQVAVERERLAAERKKQKKKENKGAA